jgi:hypothetical protein
MKEDAVPNFTNGFGKDRPDRRAKLTPSQRTEIGYRRMDGESPRDLALEFGVARNTIQLIQPLERP